MAIACIIMYLEYVENIFLKKCIQVMIKDFDIGLQSQIYFIMLMLQK